MHGGVTEEPGGRARIQVAGAACGKSVRGRAAAAAPRRNTKRPRRRDAREAFFCATCGLAAITAAVMVAAVVGAQAHAIVIVMVAARIGGRLLGVSRSRQTGDSNNCENCIAKDLGHLDVPLFKLRSCRSMTVFLRLGFGLMALERVFVSKWKLSIPATRHPGRNSAANNELVCMQMLRARCLCAMRRKQ